MMRAYGSARTPFWRMRQIGAAGKLRNGPDLQGTNNVQIARERGRFESIAMRYGLETRLRIMDG